MVVGIGFLSGFTPKIQAHYRVTELRHLHGAGAGAFVCVDDLSCILIGKLPAEITGETDSFFGG